jgi:hypothetical protein
VLKGRRAGFGGVGASRRLGPYLPGFGRGSRMHGIAVGAQCGNDVGVAGGELANQP